MKAKHVTFAGMLALLFATTYFPFSMRAEAAMLQGGTTLYSIEDSPVWRAQLMITTADVWGGSTLGSSGTSNYFQVKLNSDNASWVDTSFGQVSQSGQTYIIELTLEHVAKLRDIEMVQILKPGNDWWCVESLTLMINGRAVYASNFAGDGIWLGTGSTLTINPTQLRNHTLWRSYTWPTQPQAIWGGELMTRIDSMVGDYISTDRATRTGKLGLYWRWTSPYVYSVRVNGNGPRTVHVELPLQYWYYNSVEYNHVDVEFDLEFQCSAGKLFVATRNLDMRGYPTFDSYTLTNKAVLQTFLQLALPIQMQASFQTVTFTNESGQAACPPIRVVGNSVYLW